MKSIKAARIGNRWEAMRNTGQIALRVAEEAGDDTYGVHRVVQKWVQATEGLDESINPKFTAEHLRGEVMGVWATMLWARSGFPQVVPSDLLAASLMATKMPAECIPQIRMPWSTWVIRLPPKLLWVRDQKVLDHDEGEVCSEALPVSELWVFEDYKGRQDPAIFADGESHPSTKAIFAAVEGPSFAGPSMMIDDWVCLGECTYENENEVPTKLVGSLESLRMACRLVLGCVAELNNSGVTPESVGPRDTRAHKKRGLPQAWTFALRRPITVDCRPYVRAASLATTAKERRLPSVQTLVRGHWKPKTSERVGRLVTVPPYWRGPDTAPIAVHEHRVAGAQ